MQKLKFSIESMQQKKKFGIQCLKIKLQDLDRSILKGSHYIGDWSKGSKILFLGPNENGEMGGMVSRIKKTRNMNSFPSSILYGAGW